MERYYGLGFGIMGILLFTIIALAYFVLGASPWWLFLSIGIQFFIFIFARFKEMGGIDIILIILIQLGTIVRVFI